MCCGALNQVWAICEEDLTCPLSGADDPSGSLSNSRLKYCMSVCVCVSIFNRAPCKYNLPVTLWVSSRYSRDPFDSKRPSPCHPKVMRYIKTSGHDAWLCVRNDGGGPITGGMTDDDRLG